MENLDSSCFAYPSMRKYPVHTKEAALNSYQEFCKDMDTIPAVLKADIVEKFNKAASYHEIELKPLDKQAAVQRKSYVFKTYDGSGLEMSEIRSKTDLDQAVDFILDKRASYNRNSLREAAKYVLWAGSNSDIDIDSEKMKKIAQIAGIGVGDRDEIETELQKRATLNIFDGKDKEAFWEYVNTLKNMPDSEFYKEATLNTLCNVLEGIDTLYNNTYRYGKDMKRPEEVCFGQNIDDLIKEANDLALIPSIDVTISKKALLERADKVNSFLKEYFDAKETLKGDDQVTKVASLDKNSANALLTAIE